MDDERLGPQGHDDQAGMNRLLALSDGVFAIAMTLLVLTIHVPRVPPNDPGRLTIVLRDNLPEFWSFALSFAIIGLYWVSHHRRFRYVKRYDNGLLWLNLLLLFFIIILPYPTEVIGEYGAQTLAVILYGGVLALTGYSASLEWWYVSRNFRLIDRDAMSPEAIRNTSLIGLVPPTIFLLSTVVAVIHPQVASMLWVLPLPIYIWFEIKRHRDERRWESEKAARHRDKS